MGHYGSETPKRHKGYTNNVNASRLDLGIYQRSRRAKCGKRVETVRKYQKKDGSMGYVGTRHLKGTQPGPHLTLMIFL